MGHCLSIADLTVRISSRDPSLHLTVTGAAERFLVADASSPDVQIETSWETRSGAAAAEERGVKRFDSGAVWQLYERADDFHFTFSSPRFPSGPYKTATFDKQFTRGSVELSRECFEASQPIYPLEYPLDELLMQCLLGGGRGVELHSCGLTDVDGSGLLFVGQSGAGKSTTGGLWQRTPGVRVLSDDRIVVRQDGARYFMYGTPWHGDARLAQAARAPLERVFVLLQGRANSITELSPATAAAELFARSFPAFYDPAALAFTIRFLGELSEAVPCVMLTFVPDTSAVEFVRRAAA